MDSADPKPTGDRMVYLVSSDTRKGQSYRVDLTANGGAGECSCPDHRIRRQPFIDQGGDPFSKEGRCKHMHKTRTYFLRTLLRDLAKSEEV